MLKSKSQPSNLDRDGDAEITDSGSQIPQKTYHNLPDDAITLLDNVPAMWEPVELDTFSVQLPSNIPVYKGYDYSISSSLQNRSFEPSMFRSLLVLKDETPFSEKQFNDLWTKSGGVELSVPNDALPIKKENNCFAFLLDSEVIYNVLSSVLASLELSLSKSKQNSNKNTYENILTFSLYRTLSGLDTEGGNSKEANFNEPLEVLESVVKMFSISPEERKCNTFYNCHFNFLTAI